MPQWCRFDWLQWLTSADHCVFVSKYKRLTIDWLAPIRQCSLFTAGYRTFCNLFCVPIATDLLTAQWWVHRFSQNDVQFSFPHVLFVIIPNPQDVGCFSCYFLSQASIQHTIQLNSKSDTEFEIICISRICFSVCLSWSLAISWFRITRLDQTIVSNQIPMESNGACLFPGPY